MSKFTSLIRRAPKRFSAVVAIIAAAIVVPAAVFAWGPDRPTFTYESPAPYVTFNSITNNPQVGDERNFVRIREAGTNNNLSDQVNLQAGKTYEVSMYYHNNATTALNASGQGIAKDVKARVQMPGVVNSGETATITGFINSSNANPTSVYDEARGVNGSAAVALRYVQGSAKVTSNGAVNGATLPDSLFTTGADLGYDSLNGTLPGCNEFAGYINFKFTVDQPNFTVSKEVNVDGKNWVKTAATKPGSTVQYRITYKNTGTTQQDNVTIRDMLPKNVSYVPGSTMVANSKTNGQYQSTIDGVTANGYDAGSYAPNGNVYMKFSAKVADKAALECGKNTLKNVARASTSGGYKEDDATITVDKECKPPVVYSCNALEIKRVSRTDFQFTTNYLITNATFKKVTYVIRDASGKEIARKDSTARTLNYTQTQTGTFSVQAIITVSVNGQDKTATSDNCKGKFEVPKTPEYCPIPGKEHLPKDSPDCKETPVTPPVTPPTTPPELPTTGVTENIVAVIGLGALIASIAYYVASRRALV